MDTHRVIVTADPSDATLSRASELVQFVVSAAAAAGVVQGMSQTEAVSFAIKIHGDVYAALVHSAPVDKLTAKMIAELIGIAGGRAEVVGCKGNG